MPSGPAIGDVRAELVGGRTFVVLQTGAPLKGSLQHLEESFERTEVGRARGGDQRLLDQVVTGDVGWIDPIPLGGQGLRVAITTGGCSGYEYSLSLSPEPEPDDVLIEIDALRVFVEAASIDKLSGTVLDYVDGLYGGGLKFTNPQATHTCGCGTSFSTE